MTALKIIQLNSNAVIFIRGVGGYASNNEQDVGIYEDGVYLGRTSAALDSNFNDLERVEVAKGPQGTTFGRNSVGGALNFITKQPSNTFQFQDTLNFGNYNLIDEAAHISGPVTDKMQASASVGRCETRRLYSGMSSAGVRSADRRPEPRQMPRFQLKYEDQQRHHQPGSRRLSLYARRPGPSIRPISSARKTPGTAVPACAAAPYTAAPSTCTSAWAFPRRSPNAQDRQPALLRRPLRR